MTGLQASRRPCVRRIGVAALTALLLAAPTPSHAQDAEGEPGAPSLEDTLEAGESSVQSPRRQLVRRNEYDGPFTTLRFGAGLLYEIAGYSQDEASEQQFDLETEDMARDFRFLFKGRLRQRGP